MWVTITFLLKTKKIRLDDTYPIYVGATMFGKRFELSTGVATGMKNS
jgi:hypothetical protein